MLNYRDRNVVVEDANGKKIQFIRLSAKEFTSGKEIKALIGSQGKKGLFPTKMRMIPSLEDIPLNATSECESPDHKNHKLFKERDFNNYRGKVRLDNIIFNTIVRVGKACFGNVFYDINIEVDTILPHAKGASEIKSVSTSHDSRLSQNELSVNNSISKNSKNDTDNNPHSDRDNEYLSLAKDPEKNQEKLQAMVYLSHYHNWCKYRGR